ncbi:caspase, EACC1-associated type [Nostoc sp.]|uniref:caspase, EACC1-associated type n=1 Tax=Nostoc sp. TaxID=1180 RepID=UPI002FF911B1
MAKVALLIGVSEYEPGLSPLPAATKDVEAMERVLLHPEIGGFDDVKVLLNPQQHDMAVAIEILFDGRQKDDLVLLFFSGHGIKDESGKLYFAARNTCKTDKGVLFKATTVPASFVHDMMSNSRSKREVVILDCCFSGAFAEGMLARDDGFVDVRNQLGGEGRAVLTSSTSTQYSFEQQGADTSTYTYYIVDGLKTGAADKNEDGWISVDELHEYATKAVQEATPAMKPEIYAIKEGYKINLAKAPIDDPKLIYRREVDYWVRDGEIINMGRIPLTRRQKELGLKPDEASAIEAEVLKPYQDYKENLQEYQKAFIEATKGKLPVSDNTRADLKRLQQALGLTDEIIALIEGKKTTKQQGDSPPPGNFLQYIIGACIIGVVIGGTLVYFFLLSRTQNTHTRVVQTPGTGNLCAKETYSLNDRISLGEKILVEPEKQNTNLDKEAGVKAFAQSDCKTAIEKFNSYWQANRSDPEALIYLNNAKALQQKERLKIAVSVPIGSNRNVAKEILRGVAQEQNEVNNNGGIKGKLLLVEIANDNNDSTIAQEIASQFVKDTSILAVVGHNASNASLSAAPKYQEGGLVMIAPTGFSDSLSNFGKYIFRTVPRIGLSADRLAKYIIKTVGKTNIAICVDSKGLDNESVRDHFVTAIRNDGGTINSTDCDLSVDDLKADAIISQAISSGANALFLSPHIDRIDKAITFAKAANQRRLPIFSSPTLYTYETLEKGKADVNGMVLTAPWHPQAFPGNSFTKNSQELWGATVNWRTATAYDATRAIITGLYQTKTNTRSELQKVLRSPNFSADGAIGKIQFDSGDRKADFVLIKIQQKPGTDQYEFMWIQP